jgi:hypothetical protein
MVFLLWTTVILLLAGANLATVRSLYRNRRGRVWWGSLILLLIAGAGAGIYCTFFLEYQPTETLKIIGFPLALGVFRLEEGEWIDYVSRAMLLAIAYDVLVVMLAAVLPLSAVCCFNSLRGRGQASARDAAGDRSRLAGRGG